MAKNNNETVKGENEGLGSKLATVLLIIILVIIWLTIFAFMVKLDVGGFGSTTLRPLLKDVPVLNLILPEMTDEELAYENDYPYKNLTEAVDYIKELENLVDNLTKENEDYADRQIDMQAEIDLLKIYEQQQAEFEQRVKDFDRYVVYNSKAPSVDEYIKWYEGMYPENAADIYEELQGNVMYTKEMERIAAEYRKMKPKDAAAILSEMTQDIDLVCEILSYLKEAEVSDILSEMDTLFAARITNRMRDLAVEKYGK